MNKEVVKETMHNKLNTKVNNLENKIPNASTLIQTNQYNTDKQNLEQKMELFIKNTWLSGLLTTAVFITKLGDVENKIPEVSGLVIATVLNTKVREIENKIADVSGLVKKTDCNTKISDTEVKSDTGSDCNKCTSELLAKKKKGLVDKFSVSNLVKKFWF